jgi:hypothetical protein
MRPAEDSKVRAFRPSKFGRQDEVDEDVDRAKQDNVQQYARRAQEGLPLFDKGLPVSASKLSTFAGRH